MSDYRVIEVTNRKELRQFIKFPNILYKDCPQWVPALDSDQIKSLTSVSTLSYCEHKMWMVKDGKKTVGRISAAINPRYNNHYHTKRVRFGWFDTINDIQVARLLLDTAENWAKERGMTQIHGPLYYNTLGKQGMLVEGFENIPPFNCIYNFPYYNDLVTALGFEKECDWVQYKLDVTQGVPDKLRQIAGRLMERYKLHEADVNVLKKDKQQVHDFFRTYSDSFSQTVYNFIPFTDEEIQEEAASSIPLLQEKLCVFLQDENDKMAAFGVLFPSISKALQKARGKMFPLGWIHFLKALRHPHYVDLMINGAAPQWQHTGISAVYHCMIYDKCKDSGVKWAVTNPQIDGNSAAQVWERYDHELYMRRRCYVKEITIDK